MWFSFFSAQSSISCAKPTQDSQIKITPKKDHYAYNAKIRLFCEEGFYFSGSKERMCLANSSWSGLGGNCHGKEHFSSHPYKLIFIIATFIKDIPLPTFKYSQSLLICTSLIRIPQNLDSTSGNRQVYLLYNCVPLIRRFEIRTMFKVPWYPD